MSVSDVLATTMESLRKRGLGLVGIWLVFFALLMMFGFAVFAVIGGSIFAAAQSGMTGQNLGPGFGLGMFGVLALVYVGYILIYVAQGLAMSHYASPLVPADIGGSITTGFKGSLTMLGAVILMGIAYFVIALLLALVAAALSLLGKAGTAIFAIALIPAAIYVMCRLCILMPVVAVDGVRNPVAAIARTWNLSGGNVLAIFLSLLAYIIAAVVIFGGMFYAYFGTMMTMEQSVAAGTQPAIGGMLGLMALFVAVSLLFAATGAALVSAIHSKLSDMGTENLSDTFG